MKPLTCLLIDDEPLARRHMKALLESEPGVKLVGEAGTMNTALELIRSLRPELLFLDIRMRGGGGFEILEALAEPPAVVFVTAHDQYAVRAFEVNAVDYLLKPVDPERLRECVRRASLTTSRIGMALSESDLALIPLGASGHFVAVRDILYLEADTHYTKVVTARGLSRIVRQPFRTWFERLPAALFIQLDRGLIINRGRIASFTNGTRTAEVYFDGCTKPLVLGPSAARRLHEHLAG